MYTKEQLSEYVKYEFSKTHKDCELADFTIDDVWKFNIELTVEYVNLKYIQGDSLFLDQDYYIININSYKQYVAAKRKEKIEKIRSRCKSIKI